jgi:dihydroneopterin aldolase/2-amino-4-hydroxy-6-hydroxymethyldihydropteridine diphosphokinase
VKKRGERVFIGVGSNLEPRQHILQALEELNAIIPVTLVSTHYQTEPLGDLPQDHYINGVWQLETDWPPDTLKFDLLRKIEKSLKRERGLDKNAPRTIDLDILLYGDLVIEQPGLTIPDPHLMTRDFLALPLFELAPELVLPGTGLLLSEVIDRFKESDIIPLPQFTRQLKRRIQTWTKQKLKN